MPCCCCLNSWLFAVLLLFIPGSLSENPGLRAVITDKGLSFVCHTATDILEKALPSLPIPDITGSATFKVTFIKVTIDYSVTDIKINDLSIPGCSFTPSESGLTLGSSGISVEITAHVEAKHEGFPPLSASSDITVDLNDVSFSTTIKLSRDATNGHATLTTSACSGDIGNVHVSFHGSSAWLYNLFDDEFESAMKKGFRSAFCSKVTEELNNQGNKAMESLPLLSKFEDLAMINYTLTQDPAYTESYMAVFLKGAFQATNQQVQIPFSPAAFPPVQVDGRMMYMWLSDYMLNSAGYVFQQTGLLQYTITPKLIPKGSLLQLNTSFFKNFVPSLFKHFPNMGMEIAMKSTKPPSVRVTAKGGELSAFGSINMNVILPNNTIVNAFTLGLSTEMDLYAQIESASRTVITGNATLVSASFELVSSNIGKFDVTPMKEALNFALKGFVISAINRYASKGLVIPTIDGLSFVNPKLTFGEDYALIATDINYKIDLSK